MFSSLPPYLIREIFTYFNPVFYYKQTGDSFFSKGSALGIFRNTCKNWAKSLSAKNIISSGGLSHVELDKLQIFPYFISEFTVSLGLGFWESAIYEFKFDEYVIINDLKTCKSVNIQRLKLANIEDYHIDQIIRFCPNLTSIDISLSNITNEKIIEFSRHYPNLREFYAHRLNMGCDYGRLDDSVICALAKNCPLLTVLHVNYNNVGCIGASAIAEYCQNIKEIDISDQLSNLDVSSIEKILQNCGKLERIVVYPSWYSEIRDKIVDDIRVCSTEDVKWFKY